MKDNSAFIDANFKEYSDVHHQMKWATEDQIKLLEEERASLLNYLKFSGVESGFDGFKIDCRKLSPGCRLCGEGTWSCLFINGICNGKCFYCPSVQNEKSQPATNTVEFPNVRDYIDYAEMFNFKGIGLSGGEPLLTPDRTLLFLSEIKKHFGNRIHVWLYTNGIKADEDILKQLKDAGLDEIRFDIGATSYNLDKAKLASKFIETVTVEIPAVPEDYDLMTQKLPEMKDAGVKFLNLHQLRCTPHNCLHLIERGYIFLHGPKVLVFESEITALKLLKYSIENNIDLPVNYCSFIYKNRFQGLAAQRRYGESIKKPFENITGIGLIRSISVKGVPDSINRLAETLKSDSIDSALWNMDKQLNQIFLDSSLCRFIDGDKFSLCVNYHYSYLKPALSFMNPFKEIRLNSGKKLVIERQPASPTIEIHGKEAIEMFKKMFLTALPNEPETQTPGFDDVWKCLPFEKGRTKTFC